jgi:hypothetical protein
MAQPEAERESFDPNGRRLCRDGSCIGVIGPDGRCKVCGLADGGGPAEAFTGGPQYDDGGDDVDELEAQPEENGAGAFDPARKLCVDGSCIGVIGPDGRCTECGRSEA